MYQQKKETLAPFHIKSALKMDSLYKIVVEEPAVSFKKIYGENNGYKVK